MKHHYKLESVIAFILWLILAMAGTENMPALADEEASMEESLITEVERQIQEAFTIVERSSEGPLAVPIATGGWVLHAQSVEPVLVYGMFNPFGPTINTLSLVAEDSESRILVVYAMLNPFSQQALILGSLNKADAKLHPEKVHSMIVPIVRQAALQRDEEKTIKLNYAPTFIWTTKYRGAKEQTELYGLILPEETELASTVNSIKKNPDSPWDRATESVDQAINSKGSEKRGASTRVISIVEYLEVVGAKAHAFQELDELPSAWEGAIRNVSEAMAASAVPWPPIRDYLDRLL